MKIKTGDMIKIECSELGRILEDPTGAEFSFLVEFENQTVRIPKDGKISGIRCFNIVKVKVQVTHELT